MDGLRKCGQREKKKDMETGIFDSCGKKRWLIFYRNKGLFVCKESA